MKKHFTLFLIMLAVMSCGNLNAQCYYNDGSPSVPVFYWDLSKGNVTLTPSNASGYLWDNTSKTWNWVSSNSYAQTVAIHYILMDPDSKFNGNPNDATFRSYYHYDEVSTSSGGTGGTVNIVDRSNVAEVESEWWNKANALGKRKTNYYISVSCNGGYNVLLDNVWSEYYSKPYGGLYFHKGDNPTSTLYFHVILRGDNRLNNVFYANNKESHKLIFSSYKAGDANYTGNEGSLFVADNHGNTSNNHYNSVIGCNDDSDDCRALYFESGTVYAGAYMSDNCSAIGAGGNGYGSVYISGGTVTAVTSSTGTALGGGIGYGSDGGEGNVEISGGNVYAYNHGYIQSGNRFVPAAAIGGASSHDAAGAKGTVTIKGGTVYAQSTGGVAIGGGGSATKAGGAATVTISGSANVTAKSISGTVGGQSVQAGASIGGGTAGSSGNGGNATVKIYGGTLLAGSVGGGAKNSSSGKIGKADVTISGGDIQAQFIMQGTGSSSSKCTFTMSGGTLHNSNVNDANFAHLQTDGGALWINDQYGEATISGGSIYGCTAEKGGAVYMNGGKFYLKGGTIGGSDIASANNAQSGAGIYMDNGTFYLQGGNVNYNKATSNGGGLYMNGGTFNFNQGMVEGNQAVDGAGAYMAGGTFTMADETGFTGDKKFTENMASNNGGGVYLKDCNPKFTKGTVSGNQAVNGGGFYVEANTSNPTVTMGQVIVSGNTATTGNGGGFAVIGTASKTATINITGKTDILNNTAGGNGGGLYANYCTVTTPSGWTGSVSGNGAQYGGGVYVNSGTITLNGGTIGVSGNANTAINGAGVYVNGGTMNVNGGSIVANTALRTDNAGGFGGGVFMNGGTMTLSGGNIGASGTANTAYNGGGVYANGGTMTVSGGSIDYNSADKYGGGIYISESGTLSMSGNAKLSQNHVPATGEGGGVYLLGVMNLCCQNTEQILAEDNYAGGTSSLNNVFLTNPSDADPTHKGLITIVSPGLSNNSHVGFSVSHGFVPVIYSANETYLNNLMTSGSGGGMHAVFDDADKYTAIHTSTDDGPFKMNYIYLYGCWVGKVISAPETGFAVSGNNVTISTNQGLAWLISYVNGLNGQEAHPNVNVSLTADVDMSDFVWLPIGSANSIHESVFSGQTDFTGTFNGNGHTIKGIECQYLAGVFNFGLFGIASGSAVIENVVLEQSVLNSLSDEDAGHTFTMGGIAAKLDGTAEIRNCISTASMTTKNNNSIMGGIVGNMIGGYIKNSYTMPKFNVNSVNPSVGGIVATNTGGVVENCYVREQSGSSHGSNFSYLAYSNSTADNIRHSYAENTPLGNVKSDCGTFTETGETPYKYKQKDNLVGEIPLKQLLNEWVDDNGNNYAYWNRPTTTLINEDYPLLKIAGSNAVAVDEGDASLHYGDVNDLMSAYTESTNAIWLYDSKTGMNSNATSSAALYIDEDAALTTANDATVINATVGITLDNSAGWEGANPTQGGEDAIDWHFFSSSLSNAPVGINYTDNNPVSIYVAPNVYDFDGTGYFPATDADFNSYYNEWDFYSYYEPQYQWVNFKRNSASHYNMDTEEHFDYENEATLVPGKGYMLATKEETYLQCAGTLNNSTVSQTLSMSGPYRTGLNLLGNPYQSYLDFDEFAKVNSFIWGNKENASYIIMDEDQRDYVMYAYNASDNSFGAARYIHPHQGFMVYTKSTDKAATFNNTMRSATATSSFRGEHINYPLVNLIAYDADGNRDLTTIELGRPDKGGALKANDLGTGTGSIYTHYEDEDYSIVFTQPGINSVAVRFETAEDASYTMKWDTENGSFSYLHLIDNITGIDVDCLSSDEYRFSSKTSDFKSRFKLVFDYTGVEENETPSTDSASFAFVMDGNLVVNGEGNLEIVDLNGRVLSATRLSGTQSCVTLPNVASGLYMLRLSSEMGVRMQKIIISE